MGVGMENFKWKLGLGIKMMTVTLIKTKYQNETWNGKWEWKSI